MNVSHKISDVHHTRSLKRHVLVLTPPLIYPQLARVAIQGRRNCVGGCVPRPQLIKRERLSQLIQRVLHSSDSFTGLPSCNEGLCRATDHIEQYLWSRRIRKALRGLRR